MYSILQNYHALYSRTCTMRCMGFDLDSVVSKVRERLQFHRIVAMFAVLGQPVAYPE